LQCCCANLDFPDYSTPARLIYLAPVISFFSSVFVVADSNFEQRKKQLVEKRRFGGGVNSRFSDCGGRCTMGAALPASQPASPPARGSSSHSSRFNLDQAERRLQPPFSARPEEEQFQFNIKPTVLFGSAALFRPAYSTARTNVTQPVSW
jgi:hypothetical protein